MTNREALLRFREFCAKLRQEMLEKNPDLKRRIEEKESKLTEENKVTTTEE